MSPQSERPTLLFVLAVWFGILTGLVEGAGLLLFQRINWARWGPMMHVSGEILWISPLVDVAFFVILAVLIGGLTRLTRGFPPVRTVVAVLTFLTVYDWLTVTGRLYRVSCVVLALGAAVAFDRWFGPNQDRALRFGRRTLPWVMWAQALVLAVPVSKVLVEDNAVAKLPPAAPGTPNILVVVVDTLRADHVSAYGYARPTTPNLDRLAAQGAVFENAIATCSWSLPSHVSLLTGRYLFEHGVVAVEPMPWRGWGGGSLGGYPTLGEALERKGYRTGAFSANRTYFSHDLGFGRGFLHFEDYFHSPADMFVRTLYGREFARIYLIRSDKSLVKRILIALHFTSLLDQDAEGSGSFGGAFGVRKRANVVNDEVLRWIDRDRRHPFFAFLNYFDVHDPYGGPHSHPDPTWAQKSDFEKYDLGVKYDDDYFGRLMEALEHRGLAANTLVVVTSDHGESLGEHGLGGHGDSLYREQIHVPLVIWYPGHVPAVHVSAPVTISAIPATVLALLGGNQSVFPGPSLGQSWQTSPTDWPAPLSELAENKYVARLHTPHPRVPTAATGAMKSLVSGHWHLIVHSKGGDQLYDWPADSVEVNDLVHTPAGHTETARLHSELQRALRPRLQTGN